MVIIFIEDYVRSTNGLTRVFNASGLMEYWYPVNQMPRNGSWPLLSSMINQNHRLLVFTSIASKEASEGIAYEWNYVVENQCRDIFSYRIAHRFYYVCFDALHMMALWGRWGWRIKFNYMPQSIRIITHEHHLQIPCADELFSNKSSWHCCLQR